MGLGFRFATRRALGLGVTLAIAYGTLSAGEAHAGKSRPERGRAAGPIHRVYVNGVAPLAPICQMGEPDTSFNEINFIEPPDDSYYTLLLASQCPSCTAPDTAVVKFAHVALDYPVQCIVQAQVAIVAAKRIAPDCFAPDTTIILCPPRTVNLEPISNGIFDLAAAVSTGCKVSRDAFLCITFMGLAPECTDGNDRPRLMLSSQCPTCSSYNHFGTPRQSLDLCPQLMGRPTMYIDVEACITTPALVRSWGSLKIRYR